jgi:hypothetical protein
MWTMLPWMEATILVVWAGLAVAVLWNCRP